jgi:hypothetical protein
MELAKTERFLLLLMSLLVLLLIASFLLKGLNGPETSILIMATAIAAMLFHSARAYASINHLEKTEEAEPEQHGFLMKITKFITVFFAVLVIFGFGFLTLVVLDPAFLMSLVKVIGTKADIYDTSKSCMGLLLADTPAKSNPLEIIAIPLSGAEISWYCLDFTTILASVVVASLLVFLILDFRKKPQ